ncbi:MAG: hypothetical protein QM373_04810, partial [Bacillota bacterium]|nr:hypothetical protein [Bacillota bacterium]
FCWRRIVRGPALLPSSPEGGSTGTGETDPAVDRSDARAGRVTKSKGVNQMGRPICCGIDPTTAIFILFLVALVIIAASL